MAHPPQATEENTANYNEGLKTYNRDDKGTYMYGKKEVWYLNSVESKTMVAVFYLDKERKDAFAAKGENGGLNKSKALRSLKRIDLYSKADIAKKPRRCTPDKECSFCL